MNRPARTPGLNWVTLFLTVADSQKSLEFYTNVFGFTINAVLKDTQDRIHFARITHHDTHIVFQPTFAQETPKGSLPPVLSGTVSPLIIWMYTEKLEELYQRSRDLKLEILTPLHDKWWGDRVFRVVDINGYIWDIAKNVSDFDPSNVPAYFKI